MDEFVAALPMYDWPETRAATDGEWDRLREGFRARGIDAPQRLTRSNGDLPPASGGKCAPDNAVGAPDPAKLPPDGLDVHVLWRHPRLLLAQTCWGPMEMGLDKCVEVVGQPDYSAYPGGQGISYSSAILMRRGDGDTADATPPDGAEARIPVERMRGKRFAFNGGDSMSGVLALARDLDAMGQGLALFAGQIETGSHRASIIAVAEGRADLCAVDCRTWALARRFEPAARALGVVGWTARRKGLPLICSRGLPRRTIAAIKDVVSTGLAAHDPAANP